MFSLRLSRVLPKALGVRHKFDSLPEATIETVIDVVVEELCSKTVPSKPIMRPATGLLRIAFEVNTSPGGDEVKNKNKNNEYCLHILWRIKTKHDKYLSLEALIKLYENMLTYRQFCHREV